jgi:hypothetical protein
MICQVKPIKNLPSKITSIDPAFALPNRDMRVESLDWSPITAGPYLVPVTRWVE